MQSDVLANPNKDTIHAPSAADTQLFETIKRITHPLFQRPVLDLSLRGKRLLTLGGLDTALPA